MERQSSLMLARTSSSLLRSPTLRSSFHSLSVLADVESDPEEAKPHSPPPSASAAAAAPARSVYVSGFRIVLLILFLLLLLILILIVFYLRDEPQSLRNLSLALAGIAVSFLVLKRTRLFLLRRRRESVRWFIGDEDDHVENLSPCPKISGRLMKEGVEFYRNGDFYEGNFHRGKCNGSGVYNFYGQGRYEGDWIDGQFDGYGIEHWAKGSRYQGHYRLGLRHGFGVYRFHNGDSFAGEWVGGQSHGRGVQSCSDGSCYVGDFKFGVKHGLGFYHFRNGDRYAGEYFGDKIHGFGVYHFANGHCYEGSWHEGTRQGFGTYNFRSGEAKSGEWNCGALQNSLPPSDPNVHRFVQCGRNAAERATVLPGVEAQVSRAVAAANRAATAARLAAIRAVQNRADGKFCYNEV